MSPLTVDAASNRAAWIGAVAAACLIAQQVAGKTVRDALFLSSFEVERLPLILLVTTVVALLAAPLMGWMQSRFSPFRVIPVMLAVGGTIPLLLAGLLGTGSVSEKAASVVLYLHTGALGSVAVSGFWSVVNERFDPHSARRLMGRLGTGATLGGLVGGALALVLHRLGGFVGPLLLLALLLFIAAISTLRFAPTRDDARRTVVADDEPQHRWSSVFRAPHLRSLAMLVLLTTTATGLLDYVLKARASESIHDSGALVTFFALFYTITNLITFVLQIGVARRALERLGLANTAAFLPAMLGAGGAFAAFVPGLVSAVTARLGEASIRSSLFRSAYEPLYTPLPPLQKRTTKSIIDVGVERAADGLAAVTVQGLIWMSPVAVLTWISGLACALGLAALMRMRAVHDSYVEALEDSLMGRSIHLDPDDVGDRHTRTILLRSGTLAGLQDIDHEIKTDDGSTPVEKSGLELELDTLRSGDAERIRELLRQTEKIPRAWVPAVLDLLAWDDMADRAAHALRDAREDHLDLLLERLADVHEDLTIRRRLPAVLESCTDRRAVLTLAQCLEDRHFEIRARAARVLSRRRGKGEKLGLDPEKVELRILSELRVDDRVWAGRRLHAGVSSAPQRDASASLDHVFFLLSLILPQEPLSIARRGLLTHEPQLRGTALEYLDSVLPEDLRNALWPRVEADRIRAEKRKSAPEAALKTLMNSVQAIDAALTSKDAKPGEP